MTIVHIGNYPHIPIGQAKYSVAFKSTAPPAVQQTLASSFEALAQQCLHPKTGKPYITSVKCGRQNSPEGMTKGLEMIFVLEFEVSLLFLHLPVSVGFLHPWMMSLAVRSGRTGDRS